MSEKKYVVPQGMYEAALKHQDSGILCEAALLAAIRWLAENPIFPTPQQVTAATDDYAKTSHSLRGSPHHMAWMMMEWPRRMFLAAPEEPVNMELELLAAKTNDGSQSISVFEAVRRAYALGRKDGARVGV